MVRQVFACLAFAALALVAAPGPATAADLKTADEVIAANIAARGGAAKIEATKSARVTGKMAVGPGLEAPFTIEWQRPHKVRMEFTMQGMTGIQAYDGETAWMVMPFLGKTAPEVMPEEGKKQIVEQADFVEGDLYNYQKKGSKVELLGKEDFDGSPAYKLRLTKKDGEVNDVYVDAEANLELGIKTKREINGQEMAITVRLSNYKEVSGMMMPFSIENRIEGAPSAQTITFDKVDLNVDLASDRFKMPPAPAAPAAPPGQ